ncbi:MAG: heparan-alpha-glucosaminide N-acetyltransferase domain-containing protein [Acidobacteriota bacterium]
MKSETISSTREESALAASALAKAVVSKDRLSTPDQLRGLIMILMALDHASFFIAHTHQGEFWGGAVSTYQSVLPFVTRFVTHLCAPGFFFLMGVGMMLFAQSRRLEPTTRILRYFITRGLLLMVINLFIENPAWLLGPLDELGPSMPGGGGEIFLAFGVLYGLGGSMILSSLLLRLPSGLLLAIGATAILLTQAFTPDVSRFGYLYSPILRLLLIPGQTGILLVDYPIIPWCGLALFGVVAGRWLLNNEAITYRRVAGLGVGLLVLFALVRTLGGFGNINPPIGEGWIAFLNVTKYPPSLVYICITIGIDLFLLALLAKIGKGSGVWTKPLLVFGRTPLFFYLAHLYIYALAGRFVTPAKGTSLLAMYPYWIAGLLLLYPLCRWYGDFKQRRGPDSLWRFL